MPGLAIVLSKNRKVSSLQSNYRQYYGVYHLWYTHFHRNIHEYVAYSQALVLDRKTYLRSIHYGGSFKGLRTYIFPSGRINETCKPCILVNTHTSFLTLFNWIDNCLSSTNLSASFSFWASPAIFSFHLMAENKINMIYIDLVIFHMVPWNVSHYKIQNHTLFSYKHHICYVDNFHINLHYIHNIFQLCSHKHLHLMQRIFYKTDN